MAWAPHDAVHMSQPSPDLSLLNRPPGRRLRWIMQRQDFKLDTAVINAVANREGYHGNTGVIG